jgi:hypothetical protein
MTYERCTPIIGLQFLALTVKLTQTVPPALPHRSLKVHPIRGTDLEDN